MYKYHELKWDSNFFGFKVAVIEQLKLDESKLNSTLQSLALLDFKLVYVSLKDKINLIDSSLIQYDFKLVDEKIIYVKKIMNDLCPQKSIINYVLEYPTDQMLKLAVKSGIYSRFNSDKNISKKKFEELYELWMINSVNHTIAMNTMVFEEEEDILGMITVSEKNGRADIGIIAVDETARGKGIGKSLIKSAEKWSYDNRYSEIQVVTQEVNRPACKLYEKVGFKKENIEFFYHFWLKNNKI